MFSSYKPQGYSSISPYLIVAGADRTIRFLIEVFDAIELRRFSDPAGGIVHAEVRLDDSIIMIADGTENWPPIASHVHVYVPDVDATFWRALDVGGTSVQEPVKKDDADKCGCPAST